MVKAWIKKGKDKEGQADIGNSELQKMVAWIEVGNSSTAGVEFVMLQELRMQVMQVPEVAVNIGNSRGRVHR